MASHVIDLEALGMVGSDSSSANQGLNDCSPPWNKTIPTAKEGDTILLPPRYCAFKSPIVPLPSGVKLQGQGSVSHMVRCFSQGPKDIFLTTGVTDSWVEAVRVWAADGTSGGIAIGRHASSPGDAPFGTVLQNIEITRFTSGRFNEGVHFDGGLGTPNYGARRIKGDSITISGVDTYALWLGGCVSTQFSKLIAGAGAPAVSVFTVGYANNPCSQIDLQGAVDGLLIMYHTVASQVEAATLSQVVLDSACSGVTVECGYLNSNSPVILGTNCFVHANGQRWPA